jgi:hypothetical protein
MGCGWFATYVLLCKEEYKEWNGVHLQLKLGLVSGQVQTVCLCGSENCDGYIEKKDVENNVGMSEYDMNGILRCKIQFRS